MLVCDLIVASTDAVLVPASGRLGLFPEVGASWALTRRLGYQGAFALFLEGGHVSAAQAHEPGPRAGARRPSRARRGRRALARPGDRPAAARACHGQAAAPRAADAGWDTALVPEEFAEPNCFTTAPFQAAVRARLEGSLS